MNLPFTIISGLPEDSNTKWQRQFVQNNRKKHEGVWRRTQELATSKNSHYETEIDGRWKLAHFFDEYDLVQTGDTYALVLQKPYLWWNTALPKQELRQYYDKTLEAMGRGGWTVADSDDGVIATLNSMTAVVRFQAKEEAEKLAGRELPEGYEVLDIEVFGPEMHLTDDERMRPWVILGTGIRKSLERGAPELVTDSLDFSQYVPFHLELGCGPSIEAGVPPLAHLHKTYAISDPKTHEYLMGGADDLPVRFFGNTAKFYMDASLIYATSMKARPNTFFYESIKRLFEEGKIIDPVFTNNYDGLVSDIGMTEFYMRKFEDAHIFPDVDFDEHAKALVVVGSHADRRKLQEKARASGLKIIYVDPESYLEEETGLRYEYPVEAPQDEDILVRMSAEEFAQKILSKM
ncbi:MAG: hypothetical protein JWP06_854 [Candidatus Saccharibacteria bacterium]|nr:hypothetical protein [Candidatus Saccharibacteria bacterium]